MTRGSIALAMTIGAATRTRPAARLRKSAAADSARRRCLSTGSAAPRNSRPAVVSATRRVLRSKSLKPVVDSSSTTSWLTADAVSDSRSAAAVKLSVSATVVKASSWRSV